MNIIHFLLEMKAISITDTSPAQDQLLNSYGLVPLMALLAIGAIIGGVIWCNHLRRTKGEEAFQKALLPFSWLSASGLVLVLVAMLSARATIENNQRTWVEAQGYSNINIESLGFPVAFPDSPTSYGVAYATKDEKTVLLQLSYGDSSFHLSELKSLEG